MTFGPHWQPPPQQSILLASPESSAPMSNILQFKRPPKKKPRNTLCKQGHHKWKVVTDNKFDTKQGKLVTVYRCEKCGKEKNTAH
jgi:hypothetical protein